MRKQPYKMREYRAGPTLDQLDEMRTIVAQRPPLVRLAPKKRHSLQMVSMSAIYSTIRPESRWDRIKQSIANYLRSLFS